MKLYHFRRKQYIAADMDQVWNFFSRARNLNEITPVHMNFEIIEGNEEGEIREGQQIIYKVSPFPFFRVKWITEITEVSSKVCFSDSQKKGPFKMWHHRHLFSSNGTGVDMEDHIMYALPMGPIGMMFHPIVKRQIEKIFEYRRQRVEVIFNQT